MKIRHMIVFLVGVFSASLNYAAHPLVTEDTGTQGAGRHQIEVSADLARQNDAGVMTRTRLLSTTLTRGMTDSLDLAISLPYTRIRDDATPTTLTRGSGDIAVIAKWRFYEKDGLSFGVKPVLTLPTGDETKGLGNGRSTIGINAIAMWEVGAFAWMTTVGATHNANKIDARRHLWNVSTAIKIELHEHWAVAFDIGATRSPDKTETRHPAFGILGVIYSPNENLDLDVGFKKGLNKAEADHSVGVGLTWRF